MTRPKRQNANEAYHNCTWERLPKTTFAGLNRLKLATSESVMVFNDGELSRCQLQEHLGYFPGIHNIQLCRELNAKRWKESDRKGTPEAREDRQRSSILKMTDKAQLEDKEGPVYKTATF
jgi:hypothetical protein